MSKIIDAIHTLSTMEELASGASFLHRLHPGIKIWITFVYLVAVLSFSRYELVGLISLLFYPALMIPLAEIRFAQIFKRVLVALPFSLFAGISNIVFERTVVVAIGPLPVTLGMISFLSLMLKTFLCVSAVLVLVATTPSFVLFSQLRKLCIPRILVLTIMMTYRYIFLLLDEAASMTAAYHLRAPNKKGILMKDMGSFLGQLILRCFDRSERIYSAMECRGFKGEYCCGSTASLNLASLFYGGVLLAFIVLLRIFPIPLIIANLIY